MLDTSEFLEFLEDAFEEAIEELAGIATEEIESKKWDWPRKTTRSEGETVYKPRDIVDTGYLRDSQEVKIDGFRATIGYTADYALEVHEGEFDGVIKPGRPWLLAAMTDFDLARSIQGHFNA